MTAPRDRKDETGFRFFAGIVLMAAVLSACGKKGPPLPPLPRVPAAPANVQIGRVADDVYVWFTVPSANVDGHAPADIGVVDVYGITAETVPTAAVIRKAGTRVATLPVRPEAPPLPPAKPGEAAPPPLPEPPGVGRGAVAVVRERLTDELRTPVAVKLPVTTGEPPDQAPPAEVIGPLVAPAETVSARRYYVAVASSPSGRLSAPSTVVSIPLAGASGAPETPKITYTEQALTLTWPEAPGARRAVVAPAVKGLLAARPIVPPPVPTTYHVYEAQAPPEQEDPYGLTVPAPITPAPLAVTELIIPKVAFGVERCFEVRPVDSVGGMLVVGPPSPKACVTPKDTFPPAAPKNLEAIAASGAINLIWDVSTEPDVAGYVVLRGEAPGATLQALTTAPLTGPTYNDTSVKAGVRYVYAVVAVDNATPQNVSPQSNRAEETAR